MSENINRRDFIGITGSTFSLSMLGGTNSPSIIATSNLSTELLSDVYGLVEKTPFVDTHEHLPPESDRIANKGNKDKTPAPDFGMLFSHYADSDLQVSGLSRDDYKKLISWELSPKDKWKLIAPFYERCRNTGYLLCVRESVKALYGEDDICEENCETISQQLNEQIQSGFYRRILRDVAHIDYAQVNCLQSGTFRESEPASDLLCFDISTVGIASSISNISNLNKFAEKPIKTLKQAHTTIEHIFERFGQKAIAIKDQSAYRRRLLYENVKDKDIESIFKQFVQKPSSLKPEELKAIQDNLFRKCLQCATEYHLPVKLHTGYFAGYDGMDLSRVRDNLSDLVSLIKDFPNTTFVLMHISYPYQHELIALCKHYHNVYADMCWSWIIDPASATRFLKEFLTTAPAHKIFTFGGDYIPVELVPGHAKIARKGIALAIMHLLQEGWLSESEVPTLVQRIMNRNAHELFDLPRVLRAYRT
ncbi:MAG TPA: amidohydrolase family protein [Candidatus Hydrogenedens sp.]|nr:amidohydrolase family protein [Candidatus Hydrogenedens sp.]HPP58924.1 amidohydrolase family protein [Candidatus Hydrogenedens sp.]